MWKIRRRSPQFSLLLMAAFAGVMAPQLSAAAEAATAPASSMYRERLQRAESLLDAWNGQGDELQEAKDELDSVLREDPNSAAAYRIYARYYLGDGYISAKSYKPGALEAAENALDRALQITPDHAGAYIQKADVYRFMGRPEQARAALEKAGQLVADDDPWLQLGWADLLIDEGRDDEAFVRYKRVLAKHASTPLKDAAQSGLLTYYLRKNRLDEAGALHRAWLAADPTSAWAHGNYANFLLCFRDDADTAMVEAGRALELMDYGHARLTLAAALYRKWATLALDGNKLADEPFMAANRILLQDSQPAAVMESVCRGGKAMLAVLEAMLLTGEGERIPAMVAGVMAADAKDKQVSGLFVLKVQASGRDGDRLYLNSEADYRDARNLSVVFTPEVEAAFKRRHGEAPDEFLQAKEIVVLGMASQVRVDFSMGGLPTGKYYYQTQLVVFKPEYIRILD